MSRRRTLLKPPTLSNDEDAERARTLYTILLAASFVLTALLGISIALRPGDFMAHARYGSFLLLHVIELVILCSGRVRLAAISHCILYVLLAAATMWSLGGIRSPAGYVFPPAVLMAGLVWSGRAGIGVALASSAIGLWLVWLEQRGVLPAGTPLLTPLRIWETMTGALVITAVMLQVALRAIRTRHQEALHHARRNEALVNGAPDAMIFTNGADKIEALNPAAVQLLGIPESEATGQSLFALGLFDADAENRIKDCLKRRDGMCRSGPIDASLKTSAGEIPIEIRVCSSVRENGSHGRHLTLRDMSELNALEERRVSLERQLEHARRLEALGRLAGGVAHDFNNLLTVILGQISVTARAAPTAAESLGIVELAAERASSLTRQLLVFGHGQVLKPEVVDVNRVLAELEPLLRKLCSEDIALVFAYGPVHAIAVDRVELEQVFINLVSNARDSISGQGTIRIHTGSTSDAVWASVEDDGEGIDEDLVNRVFEPFFTTKRPGSGSGLGLATVHGIVTESGGRVEVTSKKGQGTSFRIVFPVAREMPASKESARVLPSPPPDAVAILVVDDDPLVRKVVSTILNENGYEIIASTGPADALAAAQKASRIDLVVTDVVMPGMNGPELYAGIRALHPAARVLYCSGYAEKFVQRRAGPAARQEYLQKPFSEQALLEKVRETLVRYPIGET